jgi:hypothetical protein
MKSKTSILLIQFLLLLIGCADRSAAQDTKVRFPGTNDFQLSRAAAAAGIDGKIVLDLTVNPDGKVSDLRMYGGPMWPCGSKQPDELEDVRREVKQYVLAMKFEPATKNGKPKSSDIQITFPVSGLFRDANNFAQIEENLKKGINPPLVEVNGILNHAVSAPKQLMGSRGTLSARFSEIQILVDENGDVVSAGGLRAGGSELIEARKLACSAKFKPLTLNKKPVKMAGTIMYGLY